MTSPRERGADLARFYTVTEPQRHPRGYTVYKVTARVSAVAGRGSESDQGRETGVDPGVGMPDARLRLVPGQAPEVGDLKKDEVGAERAKSLIGLEMVSIVSPFQGGAGVDGF